MSVARPLFGWYSARADRTFGHSVYKTPSGVDVKITFVGDGPVCSCQWSDCVPVGQVDVFVTSNHLFDESRDRY